jgi:apolipoprotein N-acyltransferase
MPKMAQGYLAWVALVPLLVALAGTNTVRSALLLGFGAGLIQWFLLLAWVPRVLIRYGGLPPALGWLSLVLLASYQAAYCAAASGLTRQCMKRRGPGWLLVFPLVWVSLEAMRTYFPLNGFPWLLWGYSQTHWLSLIQVADISGVFGVSFLVVWLNAALARWLLERKTRLATVWPLAMALVLLAGCLWYGDRKLLQWTEPDPPLTAVMLQGNMAFEESATELAWKIQQGYREMADTVRDAQIDLMILPESPAARNFQFDEDYRKEMEALARRTTLGLVLNNIHYGARDQGATPYFNSAYFLDSAGNLRGRYDKMYLVPFGEFIPWRGLFFFADTISKDVGAFTPGRQVQVAELDGHPVGAIICFEAIFPQLARRFVQQGSQVLVNLTNDAWYGDSAAPYQHLEMSRWRAIENRRFLLRATNSGMSAMVEPTGSIQTATGLLQRAVCTGRFAWKRDLTFYARHGDAFVWLCAMITCGMVLFCIRRRV